MRCLSGFLFVVALAAVPLVGCGGAGDRFPCTEQGIRDAIAEGGGPHLFACGGSRTVVTEAEILIDNDVILDGEGKLTVDGSDDHRVLSVAEGVTAELVDFTVTRGDGEFQGGCILNQGTLTVTDSMVSECLVHAVLKAGLGGAVFNNGTLTLMNSTVSGNTAVESGGGIFNDGTLTVISSTVSGNTAPNEGGGISNSGTLTLMNSTVTGNSADAGGGIWNTGEMTMTLTNSTVTGNSAEVGGGIWNGGALTLMNSTVSGNVAAVGGRESGLGGGIYNVGMATVTNSTLSGNTDDGISNEGTMTLTSSTVEGYGTFSYGISNDGTLTMTNSLIVSDCEGDIVSNGYNIESPLEGPGDTCGFDRPTDQPSVSLDDLDFQPLADNGGPTMTHAITTDSAALNKIPPEDCEVDKDQRGVERPQGPTCDIGAFELEQP